MNQPAILSFPAGMYPVASRRIRVLQTIRQGQVGGGESHLLSLVENLDRERYDPVVLSFTDGPMVEQLRRMDIPAHVIPTTSPFDIGVWTKVKKLMRDEQVDLVHAHGTRALSNIYWPSKSLSLPVVYTIHGWSFHDDQKPLIKKIRVLSEKFLSSRTAVNISVSQSNQQTGRKYFSSFDSVVIYNGIDLKKFNPHRPLHNIRAELNIPEEACLVVFIARFNVQKQPLTLIKSFARAAEQLPHLRLLMVGDGDHRQQALEMISDLGLKDKIYWQPFRQDVPDLLSAADIYVLPSLWEGMPIGLLEAMAMGKAVIATSVDGTREVIRHRENGLMVDAGQLEEKLADAIIEMVKDEPLRRQLQSAAIQSVKDRFDVKYMTRQIEKVYQNLADKRN
ncbi:MAG: glycosyltransferase family 4 protein [Chitinophagaceae bacterium]|nr:glycosyltransferase family 4 protein [Chitinophagaceae bacterium]